VTAEVIYYHFTSLSIRGIEGERFYNEVLSDTDALLTSSYLQSKPLHLSRSTASSFYSPAGADKQDYTSKFPFSLSRAAVLAQRRRGYGAQGDQRLFCRSRVSFWSGSPSFCTSVPDAIRQSLFESEYFTFCVLETQLNSLRIHPPYMSTSMSTLNVSAIVETGWCMLCFDFMNEYSILHNETLLQQSTLI
jgi:hypothetical protein